MQISMSAKSLEVLAAMPMLTVRILLVVSHAHVGMGSMEMESTVQVSMHYSINNVGLL